MYVRAHEHTDKVTSRTVADGVEETHEAAGVTDGLAVPEDGLGIALSCVLGGGGVLSEAMGLVGGADGEDEQQGQRRAGDEGEELGLGYGVDVVNLEGGAEAELVEEGRQELRVGFEGHEGGCRGRGVEVRRRHL